MRKEWYRYLNKTGFEDIERGLNIIAPTADLGLRIDFQNDITYQAKLDYYSWAQECLTTCSFDSMIDRLIWQHNAEGYTSREIAPVVGLSQQWVTRKIKRIASKIKSR